MKKKTTTTKKHQRNYHKSFPVVAIGASAGGLEAVTELLKNLSPTTGMAFVYVQHLDPSHKSMLSEILSKATSMKVEEVKDLIAFKPNQVYIIPPDKDMITIDGVLKLQPRNKEQKPHLPVDRFFISVAEKQNENAIGIVLSGNASDGSIGLRAIKMAGGLTMAQDESAKFPSMPKSAIAEGIVDLVLSPKEMAKELDRLSSHTYKLAQGDIANEISDEELTNILQLLNKSTGVDFSHYKKNAIRRRVVRRMVLFKLQNLKDYAKYLRQHTGEINMLYQDLLINVTSFFRDPDTMAFVKKTLLPKILKTKGPTDPVRVWISACSTGEEAYSLAIILIEVLGDRITNNSIQIFATDLSEHAINKARQGIYSKNELTNLSQKRLRRFFIPGDNNFRIVKSIRDLCVFAPHNIFKDPPFSRLDIVSCCNLLIYLDPELQKKVIATFHYALNPHGYLILGKSETVGASRNLFKSVDSRLKVFTPKKEAVSRALLDMTYRVPGVEKLRSPISKPVIIQKEPVKNNDLEKKIDTLLLERYTPASVLVNEDLDILHFRGTTGLFMEPTPGKASLNLLKMANQSLGFELHNAIHKVSKSGKPFKKSGLIVKHKNNHFTVNIEVLPIRSDTNEKNFLVIFEEDGTPLPITSKNAAGDRKIKQLEHELLASRDDMRSIVEEQEAVNEELQSANEEIVSSNEELQSINEELETSKEEVESANEELLTINQELQVRNEQLTESYEYSEAIIATIRECALVLDKDLRVKLANRTFYKKFNVEEEDTEGLRIFETVNGNFEIPKLHELLEDMLPGNSIINGFRLIHTFPGIGEKIMLLNVRRFLQKSLDQEIILLVIEDITEQIYSARLIAEREGWVKNMAENMPVMVFVADVNKNRIYFNNTWLNFTGKKLEDQEGTKWLSGVHKDDVAAFQKAYSAAYESRKPYRIEYRLRRYDGEYRWVLSVGNPTYNSNGAFTGYIGTCTEIHDQRIYNEELEKRVSDRTYALKRANFDLERSNSELEQFAYVASHDLQEPLRKIIMFCDKLENYTKKDVPSGILSQLKKIESNAGRMSKLISDLLSFSRVTNTQEKFVQTNLNEIIKNVLLNFDVIIKEKKAKIKIGTLPVIQAIPIEMTQLFHNLISNAFKFSHSIRKPKILISSHELTRKQIASFPSLKEGQYVGIDVKDNGIGFPPEFVNQVFVIFQRLNEDKIKYPGTGIGLALCKKIVNFHNGIIYAEPKDGEGAIFHIILPVRHLE